MLARELHGPISKSACDRPGARRNRSGSFSRPRLEAPRAESGVRASSDAPSRCVAAASASPFRTGSVRARWHPIAQWRATALPRRRRSQPTVESTRFF